MGHRLTIVKMVRPPKDMLIPLPTHNLTNQSLFLIDVKSTDSNLIDFHHADSLHGGVQTVSSFGDGILATKRGARGMISLILGRVGERRVRVSWCSFPCCREQARQHSAGNHIGAERDTIRQGEQEVAHPSQWSPRFSFGSTAGSPRGLTLKTCKRPRHCWTSCVERGRASSEDAGHAARSVMLPRFAANACGRQCAPPPA